MALASLFNRDLNRLLRQIDAFPSKEFLWMTLPGISNSAGNLALHIEGNLREYIGRQLGGQLYKRNRPLEFSVNGLPKEEMLARITSLSLSIPKIVEVLSAEQVEAEYPEVVLQAPMSTQAFLIHLYAHLSWHLGQIDYLRRIVTADHARNDTEASLAQRTR
jgi:hypothetical protein